MIVYGVTSDGRRIRLEEEVVSVEICEGGGGDASPAKKSVASWRASGDHLPEILRDIHYQKDVFRAIHEVIAYTRGETYKGVSWIIGGCYVMDWLRFMAEHGYTLQRSAANVEFKDIYETIKKSKDRKIEMLKGFGIRE